MNNLFDTSLRSAPVTSDLALFNDYHNYTNKAGSPTSYHDWILLSCISSVIGKKLWIPCNFFNTYANLYVILVSPPGIGQKSTAMRMGRTTVLNSEAPVYFSFDSLSPQALQLDMVDSYRLFSISDTKKYGSSALTIMASELVTLLSGGPPMAMVEFLTDIFDADKHYDYKTKNKGCLRIENPCLNLIAGATTDSFCSKIMKDAVAGGFISRTLIVFDNKVNPSSPLDLPEQSQIDSQNRVSARLAEIAELYGEVKLDKEAKTIYETWLLGPKPASMGLNMAFHSRKHIHILKVAMLLAASDLTRLISAQHMSKAMELVELLEQNMKFIYMSAGSNKQSEIHLRVVSALCTAGTAVDYSDLLAHFMKDVTQEEFDAVLATLEKVGYIVCAIAGNKKRLVATEKARALINTYN